MIKLVDRDFIHDVLEETIINIDENTKKEIDRVDKKLDKLIEILDKLL